jgi:hypothetical protein
MVNQVCRAVVAVRFGILSTCAALGIRLVLIVATCIQELIVSRKWIATKWFSDYGGKRRAEIVLTDGALAAECFNDGWTIEVVEVIEVLQPKGETQ